MNAPIVLDIFDSKNIFDRKIIKNEYEFFSTVSIPGKRKYIKNFAKSVISAPVIIKKHSENHPLLKNKICVYNGVSIESVAVIIEKVCKSVANRASLKIPLNEIIIIGSEEISLRLIRPLVNICRMFTIISDTYNIRKTDEMYFKYGCIIRNKVKLEDCHGGETIVICADDRVNCENISMQVVNLTATEYSRNNIVNIRDVRVVDNSILSIAEQWNGKTGLEIYNLLGITPDCKSDIDINTKTDKIFLLDISKI